MLEIHYDNPQMKKAKDTSGLRLHYTSDLRPNDGGIMIAGVALSNLHFIPPKQKEYKTAGYCSMDCTKEVNIFSWSTIHNIIKSCFFMVLLFIYISNIGYERFHVKILEISEKRFLILHIFSYSLSNTHKTVVDFKNVKGQSKWKIIFQCLFSFF